MDMPPPGLWLSNEFWAGVIGATVGAIVGGLVTYLIQLDAHRKTDRQRQEDRREAKAQREKEHLESRQALAHAVLYKLVAIHSHLRILSNHLEEAFANSDAGKEPREPWQFVLPLATVPNHMNFTTEEMSLVLSLKEDDAFNTLLVLDEKHNSILDLFGFIADKREELFGMLPAKRIEGEVGSTALNQAQLMAVRPHMITLNRLIEDARRYSKVDAELSEKTLFSLHAAFARKLGIGYKLTLSEAAKKNPGQMTGVR